MSEAGDWSDESNSGTPLPPALAAVAQQVLDNMMEMGSNFEIAQSIFDKRLPGKAKAKGNMARAKTSTGVAPATSTPLSAQGTTPLSYASATPSMGSSLMAQSTPTPAPRPLKAGSKFIQAVTERIEAFPHYGPRPNESEFAVFANKVLRFVWNTLKDLFFFFFFFLINGIYFNIDLSGDLNHSRYFTLPVVNTHPIR
jgi:hypothetical protein